MSRMDDKGRRQIQLFRQIQRLGEHPDMTATRIADYLNLNGILTVNGKSWTPSNVCRVRRWGESFRVKPGAPPRITDLLRRKVGPGGRKEDVVVEYAFDLKGKRPEITNTLKGKNREITCTLASPKISRRTRQPRPKHGRN